MQMQIGKCVDVLSAAPLWRRIHQHRGPFIFIFNFFRDPGYFPAGEM
jgi:hypothetical protein